MRTSDDGAHPLAPEAGRPRRILVTGWFSFLYGEATAGDVLALDRVREVLDGADLPYDVAWSPGFRPQELSLDRADPRDYSHLVFVCGPLHGLQIEQLHERYAECVRVAVGVSVIDPSSPAAQGFHRVLARDASGAAAPDLAARAPVPDPVPVVGVILTHGQHEYGGRRLHEAVAETVTGWLAGLDCARLDLETRLDSRDWRLAATPGQLESLLRRLDLVVTDRLHGLVLGLRSGVPVLAVDPVAGGAKVAAQGRVWGWPAVVPGEHVCAGALDRWLHWCLSPEGRAAAAGVAGSTARDPADTLLAALHHEA
ncbi:polysaccharide pyruvyl transferase family protein [Streptomyces sp. NPDC056600]|uniref:polysaccharide pyruvyl transferase family protein n=1 Tax=Streptomyces sp. NPDC056600 TaxID=3345874 RepID=UPI0036C0204E